MTQPGLKPTIYHTQCEHFNHYIISVLYSLIPIPLSMQDSRHDYHWVFIWFQYMSPINGVYLDFSTYAGVHLLHNRLIIFFTDNFWNTDHCFCYKNTHMNRVKKRNSFYRNSESKYFYPLKLKKNQNFNRHKT